MSSIITQSKTTGGEGAAARRWLFCHRPRLSARVRLFCFPYAGGGASVYRTWGERLPSAVEVCPVQLPGRENRLGEKAFTRLPALVEAVAEGIAPLLDRPFAFFGHSMGALVGFELARLLRRERGLAPEHLYVAAHRAPQLPPATPPSYDLPESELVEELRRLGGTPRPVLEHPELISLVLPLLRADMAVCQTYAYAPAPPHDCPVTALGGLHDPDVTRERLNAWRSQTTAPFKLRILPGDHFFLHTAQTEILGIIAAGLL